MNNIRVTYTGLIALATSLLGVITGMIFVVIVTRKITPEDFGLWTLIGSLVSYVIIIEPIISYWTTRQIARGEEIAKTALFTGGIFSIGGLLVYSIITLFISSSLGADLYILILASAFIPINFISNILYSICLSHRPQGVSYGMMSFEITKIPFGIAFVVLLHMGIAGALLTTILATSVKTIILLLMTKNIIIGEIKRKMIKFWIKMSWLPLYISSFGLIHKLDVLIFSTISSSFVGVAYWGVSITASGLVGHSGTLSQALYPKLLATGKTEFAEQNFKRTMYFAIPLLAASIIFAKPILHILNPLYVDGTSIVIFQALRTFIAVPMGIFFNIMEAYEKIDLDKNASFKQYLKSKLFFVPTLQYILAGSYIIILSVFLLTADMSKLEEVNSVIIWSVIQFVVTAPIMLYSFYIVRQKYKLKLPFQSILKYAGATLITTLLIILISEHVLTYPDSIWKFLPQIIPIVILGAVIYLGITYVIDEDTKKMIKLIINEFRIKKRGL